MKASLVTAAQRHHMLLSDLVPLLTFMACVRTFPDALIMLVGPIISRLCSLIYHRMAHRCPSLIHLDHLGICAMMLGVPHACSLAEKGWGLHRSDGHCRALNAALHAMLCIVVADILCRWLRGSDTALFRSDEHALLALALLGNLPVLALIAAPTAAPLPSALSARALLALSLAAYAYGYFILKPTRHALWHWSAAAAQAAGAGAMMLLPAS